MIKIPPNQQWVQNNKSDILGSLWSSFNLNLTEQLGKTKVSPRFLLTSNGVTNMGTPVAFRVYNSKLYAVAVPTTPANIPAFVSTNSMVNGGMKDVLTAEVSSGGGATNFSNDYSDMEVFNNKLIVTGQAAKALYFDTSTWTELGSNILSSNVNHKMLNFLHLQRLYIASGLQQIISSNTSLSVASSSTYTFNVGTATGSTDYFIISMIQTSTLIWILLGNNQNNDSYVITWDGQTADAASDFYKIPSRGVLAGIVLETTPYVMTAEGHLYYFNGGGFVLAKNGRLPVKQFKYLTNPVSLKNDRWIHPNGITIVDGRINILVNNLNHDNGSTIQESLPSGIWEYDPDVGWYHKNALTAYDLSGSATVIDYGQNRLSRVGALFNIKPDDRSSAVTLGTIVAGADYYTDSSTVKTGVFIDDSLDLIQKAGYFVTSKLLATNIQESWKRLFEKVRPLLSATDKIILKYRSTDKPATEATITWTNTSTFTTTTDVSAYVVGDEVETLQGQGSGFCAHISSISVNAGTYTVGLDITFPNSITSTGKARFQTWKKLGTFSTQSVNNASFGQLQTEPWVQIKCYMIFTGNNEMINMVVDNAVFQ